jgi:hypothetical protein
MSCDPQRDNAHRVVRRSPVLCGDVTHGPGHRCCDVVVVPRNMTAREHWSMGPTLRDASAAIDQRSSIPPPRCSRLLAEGRPTSGQSLARIEQGLGSRADGYRQVRKPRRAERSLDSAITHYAPG